eukprot:2702923-Amphidinium_carterae.2
MGGHSLGNAKAMPFVDAHGGKSSMAGLVSDFLMAQFVFLTCLDGLIMRFWCGGPKCCQLGGRSQIGSTECRLQGRKCDLLKP